MLACRAARASLGPPMIGGVGHEHRHVAFDATLGVLREVSDEPARNRTVSKPTEDRMRIEAEVLGLLGQNGMRRRAGGRFLSLGVSNS